VIDGISFITGKTRQMRRASLKQCPQCSLVFYEGLDKESTS